MGATVLTMQGHPYAAIGRLANLTMQDGLVGFSAPSPADGGGGLRSGDILRRGVYMVQSEVPGQEPQSPR